MKFEVINPNGQVVLTTTSLNCIPEQNILEGMSRAGYKFRVDGKITTKKSIKETFYENKSKKID